MAKRTTTTKRRPATTKKAPVAGKKKTSTRSKAIAPVSENRALRGTTDSADTPAFVTEGFVRIHIGEEPFELRGFVGQYVKVEYHRPFDQAVTLGTIPDMASEIADALGLADAKDFRPKLDGIIDDLGKIPVMKPIADILGNGYIKVTDLVIDTQAKKYQFGFGVDLTAQPLNERQVAGVALDAFGLIFTYTKPAT